MMTPVQLQPLLFCEPTLAGSGALQPTASRGLRPGTVISGRYEVGRLLGAGGMGLVYEARHLVLGTPVAIKVLRPELSEQPEYVTRFMAEAHCLAALSGEHVVRILDAGKLETGLPFLALERLAGRDLSVLIGACGRLAARIAVDYVLQACTGLAEAHALGLVHCDIKPANLFLASRPVGAPRIKILDFGIARWTGRAGAASSASGSHEVSGSPSYCSPEQRGEPATIDIRSDVWSLGVVLFEMLTGMRPFSRPSPETCSAATWADATPGVRSLRPEIDERLAAVVETCLERDRDYRFASVEELAGALSPFGSDAAPSPLDVSFSPLDVSPGAVAAWMQWPRGEPSREVRPLSACA